MGHPVNVVFHAAHPHHPQVSPVVYCDYGGETLLRDLRRVVQHSRTFGVSESALDLAIRWALEYGQLTVAVYNLDTPGLPETASLPDSYPIHLGHVRRKVEADPQWVLVDLAEFRAVSKHGVWELDEQRLAEPSSCRIWTGVGERRGVSPPVGIGTGGLTPRRSPTIEQQLR